VRTVHANGGIIATMCDGIAAVPEDLRRKTCQYWHRKESDATNELRFAPIVVDNRIISTAGQSVAVPSVVVLLQCLFGKEPVEQFVNGCACLFGFDGQFAQKVPVLWADQVRRASQNGPANRSA
jgi:hypothetical protein